MLPRAPADSAALPRRLSASVLLQLDGPLRRRELLDCIDTALAGRLDRTPGSGVSAGCEWLDAPGLPRRSEASLSTTVQRIGWILNDAVSADRRPRRPAFVALLHGYDVDCSLLAIVADTGITRGTSFEPIIRRALDHYASATNAAVEAADPVPTPSIGAVVPLAGALLAPDSGAGLDPLTTLLTAFGIVLILNGSCSFVIDVCLPGSGRAPGPRVVPLAISVPDGPQLREVEIQEVRRQVCAALADGGRSSPPMVSSCMGFVLAPDTLRPVGFACGPTRISILPVRHFAEWETKVTYHPGNSPSLEVECAFTPDVYASLIHHVARRLRSAPRTSILDVTAT